jgi:hypothetical protein
MSRCPVRTNHPVAWDNQRDPVGRHTVADGPGRLWKTGLGRQLCVADLASVRDLPALVEHPPLKLTERPRVERHVAEIIWSADRKGLQPPDKRRVAVAPTRCFAGCATGCRIYETADCLPGHRGRRVAECKLFYLIPVDEDAHPSEGRRKNQDVRRFSRWRAAFAGWHGSMIG